MAEQYWTIEKEEERKRQAMQAEALRQATQTPRPQAPDYGAMQGQLTGAQQTQIADVSRQPIKGMDAIMGAKTTTLGTALAKTFAAGLSGHYGRKEQSKQKKKLEKALGKDAAKEAQALAREEYRQDMGDWQSGEQLGMQQERLSISRGQEARAAATARSQEERLAAKATRDETEFGERNITNDMRQFEGTLGEDAPKRGTAAYGAAFATHLEKERAGSGRASAQIQKIREWRRQNPNASAEDERKEYQRILSSYGTTEFGDVDFFTGTGDTVLDKLPSDMRETIVQHEGDKAGVKESSKLSAQSFAYAQEQLNMMGDQINAFEAKILSEDFDGAVGLLDGLTGRISQNFPYFGDEGKLGAAIEMIASNMVLRQADFLKGNLNKQELDLLVRSVPSRSTDEDVWKEWFKDYKNAYTIAKQNALSKQARGVDPFAGGSTGGDDEIIIIN